ncbi:MAG: hypothetical protein KAW49_01660 [Anaerolineae bacterium]|nr:hypothetical protein [Anaerolineae bacterium]
MTQPTSHRTERRVKPWLLFGGGLLLLVGAAFVAGRLLAWQPPRPQEGMEFVQTEEGDETEQVLAVVEFEPPEELPDEKPATIGRFMRRDDNTLFVNDDGLEVEVVVTHDTVIFEASEETDTRQLVLEPGSLDDIAQGTPIIVWGEKRGDRITARVLVYHL